MLLDWLAGCPLAQEGDGAARAATTARASRKSSPLQYTDIVVGVWDSVCAPGSSPFGFWSVCGTANELGWCDGTASAQHSGRVVVADLLRLAAVVQIRAHA
jgi:hypothetical protein